jgi:hypothetical protein
VSRNFILAAGSILWAVVLIDVAAHAAFGDPVIPAAFAVIAVGWLAVRRPQLALLRRAA